jgi:hypothetical protein
VSHIKRSRAHQATRSCDNFLYQELQGHALRARQTAGLGRALAFGLTTDESASRRAGSPPPGPGVARAACRWAAARPTASSATAHRRGPPPPRGQPRTRRLAVPPSRTPGGRACKS